MPNHLASPHSPNGPPARPTVLLVDREALYRWFVAESLRGSGVDVVPCATLDEAAHVLGESAAPDLLIVDGELLEGAEAKTLRAVRAHAGDTPCLVLDSGGDPSPSLLGPVTVAVKPVDTAAVIALVMSRLGRDVPTA